ncbi:MAG: uroporphyrinogen-III C-methyltransferase [Candidatus Competibacterales bacterium]
MTPATVHLVGAGPGDPELLTLRAVRLLGEAQVVVFDRLVGDGVLALINPAAERFYVGKTKGHHTLPQGAIGELLVARARRGQRVVRLKGGDPGIFGRLAEELDALHRAAIPHQVVPGVTAASACAAALAIPLTHRDRAPQCVLVTGHRKTTNPTLDWPALACPHQTLVFYMATDSLEAICRGLTDHGLPPTTPAVGVERGTLADQRVHWGTVATLGLTLARQPLKDPALLLVGTVFADGKPPLDHPGG